MKQTQLEIKHLRILLILISILVFLSSCEKKETPIPKRETGKLTIGIIPMGIDYANQFYYNLKENKVIKDIDRMSWDFGFETRKEGWHVRINGAKTMAVATITDQSFEAVQSEKSLEWNWDASNGNQDSTAIGNWKDNTTNVYIIDLGYRINGSKHGYKKVQFTSVTDETYEFKAANLDNSELKTYSIQKDAAYQYSYFSFTADKQVEIAPPKAEWDLLFTTYTNIFYSNDPNEDHLPYLVNGVLLNTTKVLAIRDFETSFDQINVKSATALSLSSNEDVIGYDWKVFSLDGGTYTILKGNNYIIQSGNDAIYKLRFLDFYNQKGEKGYPTFEFQQL